MSTGDVTLLRSAITQSSATEAEKEEMIFLTRRSRNRGIVRGNVINRPVTPEIRDQVKAYKARHPHKPLEVIGRAFNVAGGRVSEILAGEHDD